MQADVYSWAPGEPATKGNVGQHVLVQLPPTTQEFQLTQYSTFITERASPLNSRPIYASIHLLRI